MNNELFPFNKINRIQYDLRAQIGTWYQNQLYRKVSWFNYKDIFAKEMHVYFCHSFVLDIKVDKNVSYSLWLYHSSYNFPVFLTNVKHVIIQSIKFSSFYIYRKCLSIYNLHFNMISWKLEAIGLWNLYIVFIAIYRLNISHQHAFKKIICKFTRSSISVLQ